MFWEGSGTEEVWDPRVGWPSSSGKPEGTPSLPGVRTYQDRNRGRDFE